jgi:hypothetical protein
MKNDGVDGIDLLVATQSSDVELDNLLRRRHLLAISNEGPS